MNEDIPKLIMELYDQYVLDAGDEVKIAEARDAIRADVIDLLAATERDLDGEADRLIRATVDEGRDKRSRSLRANLEHILGGFEEDGAYIDPLMDKAYGLGQYGTDKALRFWTTEDFQNLVVTRYRVAAEATKAASEIDNIASQCVDRMHAAGATTFGDLA